MDVCPKCGSKNLTKIDRMNGYLSYSRVKVDTRLNEAKMEEIKDRVSMQIFWSIDYSMLQILKGIKDELS